MKLGLQVRSVIPPSAGVEVAQLAERAGYDSVWFSEGIGHHDAVSSVAAAALNTSRIKVGSSVMVVYLRHPVLMGMSALTLAEISQDRFLLGLGTGHRDQLAECYGLHQDRPVRHMREYVDVLRLAIQGEPSGYSGEIFHIDGYQSRTTYERGSRRVPVFLGVLNEQMLRLAGRIADGVILAYAPKSYISTARASVALGAAQAGRDPAQIAFAAVAPIAVSSDGPTAEDALRLRIASYMSFPDHNRMLRAAGHGDTLDALREPLEQRDWRSVATGLSDALIAEIGLAGTPQTCRDAAASYADTGLDLLMLIPVALPDTDDAQHHADVVAAVAPRIASPPRLGAEDRR